MNLHNTKTINRAVLRKACFFRCRKVHPDKNLTGSKRHRDLKDLAQKVLMEMFHKLEMLWYPVENGDAAVAESKKRPSSPSKKRRNREKKRILSINANAVPVEGSVVGHAESTNGPVDVEAAGRLVDIMNDDVPVPPVSAASGQVEVEEAVVLSTAVTDVVPVPPASAASGHVEVEEAVVLSTAVTDVVPVPPCAVGLANKIARCWLNTHIQVLKHTPVRCVFISL